MSQPPSISVVHSPPGGQAILYQSENRYLGSLGEIFGDRFRNYRQAWGQASERQSVDPFPLSLDLAVNSGCQLSCLMCPLPNSHMDKKYAPMDEGLYLSLMSQAKEHSLAALTLGLASEPLLNAKTPKYIALAARSGIMDIRLGTNGQALTRRLTNALLYSGLTRLEISVDALAPATYRQIR
ncbi:MAG: radical SAM protein, partial [Deltaproteobacteria bacterium]|nr:radical SAM protein [Deltaproteobacteria bacterium]